MKFVTLGMLDPAYLITFLFELELLL